MWKQLRGGHVPCELRIPSFQWFHLRQGVVLSSEWSFFLLLSLCHMTLGARKVVFDIFMNTTGI